MNTTNPSDSESRFEEWYSKEHPPLGSNFEWLTRVICKHAWDAQIVHYRPIIAAKDREIERLREVLQRIADTDYRGNRSSESVMALEALRETK